MQETYGKGKHHARLGPHGRSWVIPCVGGRHPTTFPAELGSTSGLCARQAQARPAPGMDTHTSIGFFFLSLCRCFLWVEVGEASAGRRRRRSALASVARPRRARRAGERRRGEERRGGPRATGGAACSPVRVMRYVCLGVTSRARERKDCSGGVLSIACSFDDERFDENQNVSAARARWVSRRHLIENSPFQTPTPRSVVQL